MSPLPLSRVVKKRLCTLHVKFPRHSGMCTLDIVCYEGENIYEVLNSAWLVSRELLVCRLPFKVWCFHEVTVMSALFTEGWQDSGDVWFQALLR